jgi:DNA-binding MarR family transcriptional regulator
MTDPEALVRRIAHTQREIRRQAVQDRSHPLLTVNLTMTQLKIMLLVSRHPGSSGQDLARRTGVAVATMTGVVDRLVAQGQVCRTEDPADRRVRRLTLTEAGSRTVEQVLAGGEEYFERVLRRLDAASLEIVAQAFDLLLTAADAANDPGPDPLR